MLNLWIRVNLALGALKSKLREECGAIEMMTIVIVAAIVVAIAIVFRDQLSGLVDGLMSKVRTETGIPEKP